MVGAKMPVAFIYSIFPLINMLICGTQHSCLQLIATFIMSLCYGLVFIFLSVLNIQVISNLTEVVFQDNLYFLHIRSNSH